MDDIVDLARYPFDRPDSAEWRALVARCRADLVERGMFDLSGFLRPSARLRAVEELIPVLETSAFTHARRHNIYFRKTVDGVAPDHPALVETETRSHTVCADQIPGSVLVRLYEWPEFARFLAAVMDKEVLYTMADPLARVNAMAYYAGEALNWHFDRSEFTTTLLLQAPDAGGLFEYRRDLRTEDDPNYDGVARLLEGRDPESRRETLAAGALNVFKGRNTAHRVTPVEGETARIIAVFSFFDRPDVVFSAEERIGFYGRPA